MREILTVENPAIAAEWDYEKNGDLRPEDFTGGRAVKIWWRCAKHGHSWQAQITSRFTRGCGCPYCSGHSVLQGFNDIAATHPVVAAEWDYQKNGDLRPEQFSIGVNKKVWWKCENGHSWRTSIVTRKHSGCPLCPRTRVKAGINDLLSIKPSVAAQWDIEKNSGRLPDSVTAHTHVKAWWRCSLGHSWQATVKSRTEGNNCPYCANQLALPGYNDMLTLAPELAKEWDYTKNTPLRPEVVLPYGNKSFWWLCSKGHSWKTTPANRHRGTGCPYCVGKVPFPGETDLKTLRPDLAAEWDFEKNHDLLPTQVTVHSSLTIWWKCSRGHSFKSTVAGRHKHGCPYCSGRQPILGETDLLTVHPEFATEWDYDKNGSLSPINVCSSSGKSVWWCCKEGHNWKATINNRHRGKGCPYCVGKISFRPRLVR